MVWCPIVRLGLLLGRSLCEVDFHDVTGMSEKYCEIVKIVVDSSFPEVTNTFCSFTWIKT